MSSSVIRLLVLKDLYFNRGLILGALIAGGLSLVASASSRVGFNFGSVIYITTIIATGVILAMYGVLQERKDRSDVFVLSLPLSGTQYACAKVLGMLVTYLIPWTLLTAGAAYVVATHPVIPGGLLPFALMLSGYCLFCFSFLVSVGLHVKSEGVVVGVVVGMNLSVTLFMFLLDSIPSVAGVRTAAVPLWNGSVFTVLAVELAAIIIAFSIALFAYGRKRDLV
jgi:ABC-2 type transport system permease protein